MGINNPLPTSLTSESRKAAKILNSFIKPNQLGGPSDVIPPEVLANAKGLAILTVLKAGFLFSGRAGSGVVVARLPDGSWSGPSAIVTAGAGVGGQIGAELTDFVMILNSRQAVETFAQLGSVTLGGNISIAAGPLGRNVEADGTASLKSVAAIFSYSKTKGLFAGVSLEGSVIAERRDANRKFYGPNATAAKILSGQLEAPPGADPLLHMLESRIFSPDLDEYGDSLYDDLPSIRDFDTNESDEYSNAGASRRGSRRHYDDDDDYDAYSARPRRSVGRGGHALDDDWIASGRSAGGSAGRNRQKNRESWEDDIYDRSAPTRANGRSRRGADNEERFGKQHFESTYSDSTQPERRSAPVPPRSKKPSSNGVEEAVAKYTFEGEQSGDLSFRKGDYIEILKKTDTVDAWWTGRLNGKEGIFPANYVRLL
ncbi:hypothetical protein CANCADRAFT_18111, partial [Tortispora caseinolytica NRRL Y-17796]